MKKVVLFIKGDKADHDRNYEVPITGQGQIFYLADGSPVFINSGSGFSTFELLPNLTSLAAGKDPQSVMIGTGTEVVTRSAKGGINIKSQATSPADNDNVILVGVAASPSFTTITAAAPPRFRTRVNLARITLLVFGAGLDENITSPVSSATAGDGASFQFDPLSEVSMVAGQTTNWVLAQKVAGVDTYIDSGVAVLAGVDYDLDIRWNSDRKPLYYINGALVGTGVANTADAAVGLNIGGQMNGTPGGLRVDADIRYFAIDTGVAI